MSLDTYRLINEVFLLGDDIDRQLFSAFTLTVRQYHLLHWLDQRGASSLTELAQLLLCDKSNVTGIVRRLIAAHLIEKISSTDRRFTRVRLTEQGKALHDEAERALNHSIMARFSQVLESDHIQIQELLRQLHQHLHHYLNECADPHLPATHNSSQKGVMP